MRTDNAKKPKEKKPRKVYSEKHKSPSAVHVLKNVVLVICGLILIAMLAAIIYAAVGGSQHEKKTAGAVFF